ncbi:MAG: hypothetical protein M1817_005201 [Caeruleum heppii]|nr:MAG: hypothetical protein M1817_005201 [Caeruleum heppii]
MRYNSLTPYRRHYRSTGFLGSRGTVRLIEGHTIDIPVPRSLLKKWLPSFWERVSVEHRATDGNHESVVCLRPYLAGNRLIRHNIVHPQKYCKYLERMIQYTFECEQSGQASPFLEALERKWQATQRRLSHDTPQDFVIGFAIFADILGAHEGLLQRTELIEDLESFFIRNSEAMAYGVGFRWAFQMIYAIQGLIRLSPRILRNFVDSLSPDQRYHLVCRSTGPRTILGDRIDRTTWKQMRRMLRTTLPNPYPHSGFGYVSPGFDSTVWNNCRPDYDMYNPRDNFRRDGYHAGRDQFHSPYSTMAVHGVPTLDNGVGMISPGDLTMGQPSYVPGRRNRTFVRPHGEMPYLRRDFEGGLGGLSGYPHQRRHHGRNNYRADDLNGAHGLDDFGDNDYVSDSCSDSDLGYMSYDDMPTGRRPGWGVPVRRAWTDVMD